MACGGGWSLTAEAQLVEEVEEDARVESVLSRSEESESRVLRDGSRGVEQGGQLHGANLWYSAAVLRAEHLR